jgi:lipid-A-disaccharide synthase
MEVTYVGHPLMDTVPRRGGKSETIDRLGLTGAHPVLGLLPGSRKEEIRNLLPPMVETLNLLISRFPRLKCVLPLASTISADLVEPLIRHSPAPIRISKGGVNDALAACDLALVASGTAALETAVMEVPMVVVYRVSRLSYWIGKRIIKVPFISLVNLVAQEGIVPELIQDEVTPPRLAREALSILEQDSRRVATIEKLREVKKRLGGGGASKRTARMALDMMAEGG